MEKHQIQRLLIACDSELLVGVITGTKSIEEISETELSHNLGVLQDVVTAQTSKLQLLSQELQKEINKTKLLEERLRTSEAQMRATFEAMTDIVLIIHTQGSEIENIEILPTNPSCVDQYRSDLIDQTVEQFLGEETNQAWLQQVKQALDAQKLASYDYSLCYNEHKVWFSASISPISENAVLWVARDITQRKQAEIALRESEERFRAIYEEAAVGIYQATLYGDFLRVNPEFSRLLEYKELLLLQRKWQDITFLDDLEPELAYIRQMFVGQISHYSIEKRFISKYGKLRWARVSVSLVRDDGEVPQYLIGVVEDISARKMAEIALRESEEIFCAIFEQAAVGIYQATLTGELFLVNPRLCEILGYSESELLHLTLEEITDSQDLESDRRYMQHLLDGEIPSYITEKRLICQQGRSRWIKTSISLVRNEHRKPKYFIGIVEDVSERKTVELALQQSEAREREKAQTLEVTLQELQQTQAQLVLHEKMASLGQFVAGVAHEINNPTSFIYGNIQPATEYTQRLLHLIKLYQQHYPNVVPEIAQYSETIKLNFITEDFPKLLASMTEGANRISQIVQSLQNFSRLDQENRQQVDIHQGIENTLLILQYRLKQPNHPEIQLIKEYGQIPLINCYPGLLNQVFMNILCNAIDALEEELQTRSTESLSPTIRISTRVLDSAIAIFIADNGSGIKPEIQPKIFDPFFTTKPPGNGTGLGLSISYKIVVEWHNWEIDFHSRVNVGTEFVIKLPIASPEE
ncbi:PAS domain S-box protein [Aetokthonos hydrillicola]|uniref:PAS domain S-box protein n=1 Tax=Aetokthonos hydrillicola TaxID=1550245 RepID=UPI001ABA4CD5|nr:PAS domain S-box protein [Aetokthonos hydrillicola]MBO3460200.1 PAS domain S-box protein [Aetokthonos hydrillicola CCALA 1050]